MSMDVAKKENVSTEEYSAETMDTEQAKKALSAFLSDPKAQALLRQLEAEQNG